MSLLAQSHKAKTIVGIQGSFSPVIRKMKTIIKTGRIGKVLSSTIMASLGNGDVSERKNVKYFLEREVGGNVISIHLGHSLEFIAAGLFPSPFSLHSINPSSISSRRVQDLEQFDGDQE
jgi:predicted dehydrogenase